MSPADLSGLITALAALVAACASGASIFVSMRNSRKIDANTAQIKEVHDATNGMKTELVEAVRSGSLATGKAEGLAQGRAEDRKA